VNRCEKHLADRTNGRSYATVLCPSVVCLSSVTYTYCGYHVTTYRTTVWRCK